MSKSYLYRREKKTKKKEKTFICPKCDFTTTDDSVKRCPECGTLLVLKGEEVKISKERIKEFLLSNTDKL